MQENAVCSRRLKMAEEGGFEPPSPLQVKQFSRLPHSTALPPLHGFYLAERWGFEPQMRFWRIHDFQSCSFGQLGHLSLLKLLSVIATLKYNGALLIEQVLRYSFLHNSRFTFAIWLTEKPMPRNYTCASKKFL